MQRREGAPVVGAVIVVGMALLVGACRREPEQAAAPEATLEGTPAQAVLVAPEPSEVEPRKGQILGAGLSGERPRSRISLTKVRGEDAFHVAIEDPFAQMFDTGEGMIVRVRGGGARRERGAPDVGGMAWVLPGRTGYNLMPTITDAAFAAATQGVDIAAVAVSVDRGDDETPAFERYRAPEIYGANAFYPSHVVRVQESQIGTNKLVRLVVNPVQYNPVTRDLRLCYRLKARLEYVATPADQTP